MFTYMYIYMLLFTHNVYFVYISCIHAIVHIHCLPLFLLSTYQLHEIDSVVAIDPDKPFNPMGVTYSIESASNPNGVFTINENGTIFATKPVDREVIDEYNLKIMVNYS